MNIITAHTGATDETWKEMRHWVPPSKKAWDWYTANRNGDVHIFEDVHLPEHVNYNGKIKIALLEEVPAIYDNAQQYDANMFHPYKWIKENHQHFDYVMSTYRFLEDIVGKERYQWICFHLGGIPPDKFGMYEKERLISILVSHKNWTTGHKMRHEIVAKLKSHIDVYGKGYNSLIDDYDFDPVTNKIGMGKIIGLAPYCYSIIVPNSNIDDFFSEQLTDAMVVGTIPVFCGTKGVRRYFNMDGIIEFSSVEELTSLIPTLTFELYNSKIKAVSENLEIAKTFKTTVDWLYDNKKDFLENLKPNK